MPDIWTIRDKTFFLLESIHKEFFHALTYTEILPVVQFYAKEVLEYAAGNQAKKILDRRCQRIIDAFTDEHPLNACEENEHEVLVCSAIMLFIPIRKGSMAKAIEYWAGNIAFEVRYKMRT